VELVRSAISGSSTDWGGGVLMIDRFGVEARLTGDGKSSVTSNFAITNGGGITVVSSGGPGFE